MCIDTSIYVPNAQLNSLNWDVTLAGNLALVSRLQGGMEIFDVSVPGVPVFKDNFPSVGSVFDAEVSGPYAYLAESDNGPSNRGVIVVSLSNLMNLQQVGGNTLPVTALDVALADSLLFVADGTVPGKLWIMSLTNPLFPSVIGSYTAPHQVRSVFVLDTLAYVALAQDGIAILDVSDPTSPQLVGSLSGFTSAYDIYVVDTVAYVANVTMGLGMVDVSDPTAPVLLSTYDTPGYANEVEVINGFAHVADLDSGYLILDVSDPATPTLVERVHSVDRVMGLAVGSTHTFAADDSTFTVFAYQGQGVCGDAQTGPCEQCDDGNSVRGDGCSNCESDAGVEVCASGHRDLNPRLSRGAVFRDSLLFAAVDTAGLMVFNVRYSGAPLLIGRLNTPGIARRVSLDGSLAAVALDSGGMALVDVSDPSHLVPMATYPTSVQAHDVELADSLAYLTTWGTLHVVDVSNPSSPALLGTLGGIGAGYGIKVVGQRAYIAGGSSGLLVVDISNPAGPAILGSRPITDGALEVDAKQDTVYVAGMTGLTTLDASTGSVPGLIDMLPVGTVRQVLRLGGYLYLANGNAGLTIYTSSPPTSPQWVNTIPAYDGTFWVAATPGRLGSDGIGYELQLYTQSVLGLHWCGNGILETGEDCDDSNYVSGDDCSACCLPPAPPSILANGNIEPGEECDDGNSIAGDGCSPTCQLEPTVCGNGIREYDEECDDGNANPNDGCDGCLIKTVCGNGVIEFREACDDGNADPYDGCDGCELGPVCGNGVVTAPEECDDGGRTPGDGCDAGCQYEHTCGDGNLEPGEECDDGNTLPGDGCTSDCRILHCLITVNGDINNSNTVTSADIITLIGYVFKNGPCPLPCCAAGDVNCSGSVTSADIITLVGFVFKGGVAPCDICSGSLLAESCE